MLQYVTEMKVVEQQVAEEDEKVSGREEEEEVADVKEIAQDFDNKEEEEGEDAEG